MIWKVLMLLAIVVGYLALVRVRQRRPLVVSAEGGGGFTQNWMKPLAVVTLVVMLSATLVYAYLAWQDGNEIVLLQVVDGHSGKPTGEYQARRGDIDERSFVTLDGREVTLADSERLIKGPKRDRD